MTPGMRERLLSSIDLYDRDNDDYDSVFREVSGRIVATGSAGKTDIAVVTFWKRSGQGAWITKLLRTPEDEVREATRLAFAAPNDSAALAALRPLPGFGTEGPLATALLCAADPHRWAVLDRRAWAGLRALGIPVQRGSGQTRRYLETARALRDDLGLLRTNVTARDVDKGLFILGASG